jgi:hypothetical protein
MVTIEFTQQFLLHDGAQYNAGERATVPQAVAIRAVALGCAQYVEETKQMQAPAQHKQLKRALAAK